MLERLPHRLLKYRKRRCFSRLRTYMDLPCLLDALRRVQKTECATYCSPTDVMMDIADRVSMIVEWLCTQSQSQSCSVFTQICSLLGEIVRPMLAIGAALHTPRSSHTRDRRPGSSRLKPDGCDSSQSTVPPTQTDLSKTPRRGEGKDQDLEDQDLEITAVLQNSAIQKRSTVAQCG